MAVAAPQRGLCAAGAEDKQLVAQSKEELQAAPNDGRATVGFYRALRQVPALSLVRNSLALIGDLARAKGGQGSATLLDEDGTLLLAAHEAKGQKTIIVNFFTAAASEPVTLTATIDTIDPKLDVAFATVDAKGLAARGIKPINWGSADAVVIEQQKFVIAGYALGRPLLHAALVVVQSYEDHAAAEMFSGVELSRARQCKLVTRGVGHFGMSGGSAIDEGGALAGMVDVITNAKLATVYLTPMLAIRSAYVAQYPDRATKANVTAPRKPMPSECRVGVFQPWNP